jgi:hypothetical protein
MEAHGLNESAFTKRTTAGRDIQTRSKVEKRREK